MSTRVTFLIILIACVVSGITGWYLGVNYTNDPPSVLNENTLAIVNGQPISANQFMDAMKKRGGLKKGQYHDVEQKKKLLDLLIAQEVVHEDAIKKGYAENPVVNELYRKTIRDRYLDDELDPVLRKIKVSNNEIKSFYNQNKKKYDRPERRRAAIIFVEKFKDDTPDQLKNKKDRINKALEETGDIKAEIKHFGELAKFYSDDKNSRYQGGVVGWLINHPARKYKWGQEVIDELFSLENIGDISPVLETDKGFYLVRLVSTDEAEEKPLSGLEKGIKNKLLHEKRSVARKEFIEKLKQKANIEINEKLLIAIEPLSEAGQKEDPKPPAVPAAGGE